MNDFIYIINFTQLSYFNNIFKGIKLGENMKTTSYFVFAFLFSVILFISGCSNDNITTPTVKTDSKTSENPLTGDNVNRVNKSQGGTMTDGCSSCYVTFYCYGAGSLNPMPNIYIDIYQGASYITTVGPTDSTGNVSAHVGTFPIGSTTADSYSLNHFFMGGAVFTHTLSNSQTVEIEMWEMGQK